MGGEGEPRADLGPPTIKIFISGNSGSKEITNNQHRILMILKSLGMLVEVVDISAPGMDEQRDLMRASAKKKEGQRHALPPQIFNKEKYCGDYDDFDIANEDDELEEFLGLPRKTPKTVKGEQEEEKKPQEEGEEKKEGEAAGEAPTEAPVAEAPAAAPAEASETPTEAAPSE